jgi:hypothetical protein
MTQGDYLNGAMEVLSRLGLLDAFQAIIIVIVAATLLFMLFKRGNN